MANSADWLSRTKTISRKRAAEAVLEDIRSAIESGQLAVGARLPSEALLSERYGVSRPIIREAPRSVQTLIAGRTVRDIQLTSPVRPGMTLRATLLIGEVRPLRPDRALVTEEGRLDHGDTRVFTVTTDAWVRRRPAPAPDA